MKMLLGTVLLVLSTAAHSDETRQDAPGLIVLVGVDQFGSQYLERYKAAFSGGIRRMLEQGAWYRNATVDHAPTVSLPGHTTLATGANPRTHGITSNGWVSPGQAADESGLIRATIPHWDPQGTTLGWRRQGTFSRQNILVDGLADWVRKADGKARTVALSVSGLAVMYGGRASVDRDSNHVYWLGSTGRFMTSAYYRDSYPDWVERFNDGMPDRYIARHVWENTVPAEFLGLAREDRAGFEHDGLHTGFPHRAEELAAESGPQLYDRWFGSYSPFQNDALFDLARESVKRLELGQRKSLDLLCIAVKLTDRIGHDFGPGSLEQLDVVLRLDRLLGGFFDYLDKVVGEDNYVVALSSDHGAPNISEYEQAEGRVALRVSSEDIEAALESVSRLVQSNAGAGRALPKLIARDLERFPFIARAMTEEDMRAGGAQDAIVSAYRNSFLAHRAGIYPLWTKPNRYGTLLNATHPANFGVFVELVENANIWSARSTHGSSYDYDRRVPILFMGKGVTARVSNEAAFTRDVAPTLASAWGVEYPDSVDGRVLGLDQSAMD